MYTLSGHSLQRRTRVQSSYWFQYVELAAFAMFTGVWLITYSPAGKGDTFCKITPGGVEAPSQGECAVRHSF